MEALIGQVKQRTGRQTLGSNRNWPTAAAHRLRPYRSASGLKSREHPWCPEVQDWGRSTSFAARNRDPTVALRPQCLRGSESGPAACARTVRRPGPSAAMARRAARLPIPSVRAEEHSFRRIRAARCLSEASLRGPRLKRASQVAPKGSRTAGSPSLWCLSLGDARERYCAAGRTSRHPPLAKARSHSSSRLNPLANAPAMGSR